MADLEEKFLLESGEILDPKQQTKLGLYKHKIIKVVPEERGKAFNVLVHHRGKLTNREKKFLRKHFRKKYGHKKRHHRKNKVKIVFVLN